MKDLNQISEILQDPTLEIREMGKAKADSMPFSSKLTSKTIQLTVPSYAKVCVRDGLRWVDIHNGQQWGAYGVDAAEQMAFSFPSESELKISAQGKQWLVRLRPTMPIARKADLMGTLKSSRYFGFSLLGHVNILLLLWIAVTNPFQLGVFTPAETPETQKRKVIDKVEPAPSAGGSAPAIIKPFEGMSFTEYNRRVEQAKREADPLGYLAQSLNKMKAQPGMGKGVGGGVQSAAGVIGTGLGKGGTGTAMTDVVSGQQFNLAAADNSVTRINDKQKLALREKFRDLQDDFKRIYSKLLSQDPNLSVTVAFQTKVQGSGYLELSDFKARGTYQPASLPALKSAMAEVIRGVFVGPELSGLILRGENVFVR